MLVVCYRSPHGLRPFAIFLKPHWSRNAFFFTQDRRKSRWWLRNYSGRFTGTIQSQDLREKILVLICLSGKRRHLYFMVHALRWFNLFKRNVYHTNLVSMLWIFNWNQQPACWLPTMTSLPECHLQRDWWLWRGEEANCSKASMHHKIKYFLNFYHSKFQTKQKWKD